MKDTIAVIGHTGMVGSVVYSYFKNKGHEVLGYSKSKNDNSYNEINTQADWVFVCVPTPYNWKNHTYDLSIIRETLDLLTQDKKVVIKSTVVPGTTEKLQKEYPHLTLFFNPEFLSEKTAHADFINPDRQIIGYTKGGYSQATKLLHLLPMSPYDVIMTTTEAEIVKYMNNFHGALMVIFANMFYDICNETASNYDKVVEASIASKWVGSPMGRMYWNVLHNNFRGYGGKCFPKDINSLMKWCNEHQVDHEILRATHEANVRLLESQNMTEQQAEDVSSRNV